MNLTAHILKGRRLTVRREDQLREIVYRQVSQELRLKQVEDREFKKSWWGKGKVEVETKYLAGRYRGRLVFLTNYREIKPWFVPLGLIHTNVIVSHEGQTPCVIFLSRKGIIPVGGREGDIPLDNAQLNLKFKVQLMDNKIFTSLGGDCISIHFSNWSRPFRYPKQLESPFIGFERPREVQLNSGERVKLTAEDVTLHKQEVSRILSRELQARLAGMDNLLGLAIIPREVLVGKRGNRRLEMVNKDDWIDLINFSVDLAEKVDFAGQSASTGAVRDEI